MLLSKRLLHLNKCLSRLAIVERLLCRDRWNYWRLDRNLWLRNKRRLNNWLRSGSLNLRYWCAIEGERSRCRLCCFRWLSSKNIKLDNAILLNFRLSCLRFYSRLLCNQRFFFFSRLRQLTRNLFKRLFTLYFDCRRSFFLLLFVIIS